jgi:hypothetical protein
MKTLFPIFGVAILALLQITSAQETIEFQGPENAPIYVMEGDFKQSATMNMYGGNWDVQTDMQSTMEINTGAMNSAGQMSISGSGSINGMQLTMDMDMSFAMKAVAKQAGKTIRWSGDAAMSGPMLIQPNGSPAESFSVSGIWKYKNISLDPETGEQTGTMSYKAVAVSTYGQRIPMSQPASITTFPRPTIYASEGEWQEIAGDWSADIVANVYPNGKITGTGDLIVGDPADPYANVDQNIKGKLNSKTGVVSLIGSGATKSTSKVKVTLNYLNSTGDTISGKSSVNAFAQSRKF